MKNNFLLAFLDKVKWFGLRKIYWVLKNSFTESSERLKDTGDSPPFGNSLIKRGMGRTLITQFSADAGQNINLNQYFPGFGLVHYSFVRNIKPKNILCVGSRKGFVPAVLALACKDNGVGHVDFVDAGYDESDTAAWSGVGFWKKNRPEKHFGKLGINKFLTTYVMTTKEFSKTKSLKYDYIYIDGDHSYPGVKLDYKLFWPKLNKGGFMVFHDVFVKHTKNLGDFGVWKFWKEIKSGSKIIFPFPKDSGLGILQKP